MGLSRKQSFEAMRATQQEMETISAERRVVTAHEHRAGPFFHPAFKFCDKVRVWREDSRKCEGPYIFHSYENRKPFRLHSKQIVPFSTCGINPVHIDEQKIQRNDEASISPNIITELEQM